MLFIVTSCVLRAQVYWKNEHPRFPEGGKMSQCLEALPIGGEMEVKGPLGHMHYLGRNRCNSCLSCLILHQNGCGCLAVTCPDADRSSCVCAYQS